MNPCSRLGLGGWIVPGEGSCQSTCIIPHYAWYIYSACVYPFRPTAVARELAEAEASQRVGRDGRSPTTRGMPKSHSPDFHDPRQPGCSRAGTGKEPTQDSIRGGKNHMRGREGEREPRAGLDLLSIQGGLRAACSTRLDGGAPRYDVDFIVMPASPWQGFHHWEAGAP
ncbi:hypothetical protein LZ30DRAFT_733716 [Colletotrichum cereale]|nr:hypothetical protein LZ30DRAFT_733716 [Colletotrichum cereale]